jgi:membrane-associated protease RseP (regulator of RpoE activity)
VHEFGHYIAARRHGAKVTLPYYIPFWLGWLGMFSIGTLGAFIRILTPFKTRYQLFDVGVAGPLAGYVATVLVLIYGYTHLPPADYIFSIHPEYISFGQNYAEYVYSGLDPNIMLIKFGDNPTMNLLAGWLADPALLPNPYEAMHYPYLFAGQFALFFTALNLFPIGQLDGGHILYGLVGPVWHRRLSPLFFILLVAYSGIGIAQPVLDFDSASLGETLLWNLGYLIFLYLTFSKTVEGWQNVAFLSVSLFAMHYAMAIYVPEAEGFQGWLVFSFIVGRFLGVYHPPTLVDEPLSPLRKVVGVVALVVFLLSFSLQPFGVG